MAKKESVGSTVKFRNNMMVSKDGRSVVLFLPSD